MLAAGLAGCSSGGSSGKTTVTKDADYYTKLFQEGNIGAAYDEILYVVDTEDGYSSIEFSANEDDNDFKLAPGERDDCGLYFIGTSTYVFVGNQWTFVEDDEEYGPTYREQFDLDSFREFVNTLLDASSVSNLEVTEVANNSDTNSVTVTDPDLDADTSVVFVFDAESDQVLNYTRELGDERISISFTDDDWQTAVQEATKDEEPTDNSFKFTIEIYQFWDEMNAEE